MKEMKIIVKGKEIPVQFESEFTDTKIELNQFGNISECDGKLNVGMLQALSNAINENW